MWTKRCVELAKRFHRRDAESSKTSIFNLGGHNDKREAASEAFDQGINVVTVGKKVENTEVQTVAESLLKSFSGILPKGTKAAAKTT